LSLHSSVRRAVSSCAASSYPCRHRMAYWSAPVSLTTMSSSSARSSVKMLTWHSIFSALKPEFWVDHRRIQIRLANFPFSNRSCSTSCFPPFKFWISAP
jgi:hypothetical protein